MDIVRVLIATGCLGIAVGAEPARTAADRVGDAVAALRDETSPVNNPVGTRTLTDGVTDAVGALAAGAASHVFETDDAVVTVTKDAEGNVDIRVRPKPPKTEDTKPVVAAAGVTPNAERRGDMYRVVFEHPDQTFLDTKLGPVPLYTDVVFDANGQPKPRFPNYYAKRVYDDPTEDNAQLYLEYGVARMRRIKEVVNVVQKVAGDKGYIVPDDFAPDPSVREEPTRYQATPTIVTDKVSDLGTAIFNVEQARRLGIDPSKVPSTPGIGKKVEILYFWDARDEVSESGIHDFAEVGWEMLQTHPNVQVSVRTVDISRDKTKLIRRIDWLQWRGAMVHKLENFDDWLDMRRQFGIARVPTYLLIDKRRGVIERWEGVTDGPTLRTKIMGFLGIEGAWKPDVRWFATDYDRAKFDKLNRTDDLPAADGTVVPGASPAKPPDAVINPWLP